MIIATDTNLLVYAHRQDSAFHKPARDAIQRLAEGADTWLLPWPCIHEFYSCVTHPRRYVPATSPRLALKQIEAWLEAPCATVGGEQDEHLELLSQLVLDAQITGPLVHDAKIAAICLAHGVGEFWSADRDFSRFPQLTVVNPLIKP